MGLFLVVAAPLWFLLIASFYPIPTRGWRGLGIPFLSGILIGLGTLVVTLSLLTRTPFGMEFSQLFRWAWIRGPGWPYAVAVPILTVVYLRKPTSYSRIRELSGWCAGLAWVFMIWLALSRDPGFDAYRILLAPILWLASAGSVAWLIDRGLRLDGLVRFLPLTLAMAISTLFMVVPMLSARGESFAAWVITVILLSGSTVLAFLDSRGQFA